MNHANMDACPISIVVRDINGKRDTLAFDTVDDFNNADWNTFDEEIEILLVTWGGLLIYSQLRNNPITIEDLIGFFA